MSDRAGAGSTTEQTAQNGTTDTHVSGGGSAEVATGVAGAIGRAVRRSYDESRREVLVDSVRSRLRSDRARALAQRDRAIREVNTLREELRRLRNDRLSP